MKAFLPLVVCLLWASSLFAQTTLQESLNVYRDSLTGYGIVALRDHGETSEIAAIGEAWKGRAMTASHRFNVGSCTKMFTAVVVLQLQEEGLLDLSDSLHKYLEPHSFIDSNITLKQLLNHTSGIHDVLGADLANAVLVNPYDNYSFDRLIGLIDTIDFKAGSRYRYSNSNYFLLQHIVEQVTDKPFSWVLYDRIITPLKLENTFPYVSNQIPELAHPIWGKYDLHDIPKQGENKISQGLGNIVTTAGDLNAFVRAIWLDKTLLDSTSLEQMTDFYAYKKNRVGLGMFVEEYAGKKLWGHTGRSVSYIAYAMVDPESGTSYILLNNNANDPYIDRLMEEIVITE